MSEGEIRNLCTAENGVQIVFASSFLSNCSAANLLLADRKALWMSQPGLPQTIIIDLTNMIERPKMIKCFGFDCWHDYSSNPRVIEL